LLEKSDFERFSEVSFMDSKPGTYALILRSRSRTSALIGRWGRLNIDTGYYIYVGSAFGPGGVRARVFRHCRENKPKHWHIDYLRERVDLLWAWYSHEPANLEHHWAQALSEMNGIFAVKGFGCSDCKCYTHLFAMDTKPTMAQFANAIGGPVEAWSTSR
jgi:Uri superfamily endonuclease